MCTKQTTLTRTCRVHSHVPCRYPAAARGTYSHISPQGSVSRHAPCGHGRLQRPCASVVSSKFGHVRPQPMRGAPARRPCAAPLRLRGQHSRPASRPTPNTFAYRTWPPSRSGECAKCARGCAEHALLRVEVHHSLPSGAYRPGSIVSMRQLLGLQALACTGCEGDLGFQLVDSRSVLMEL